MSMCPDCRNIVQHQRGVPGHDKLICLEEVRSLASATRGARHEAFVCSVCNTEWDHVHDKKDANVGWTPC